jgi:hypothetical protein
VGRLQAVADQVAGQHDEAVAPPRRAASDRSIRPRSRITAGPSRRFSGHRPRTHRAAMTSAVRPAAAHRRDPGDTPAGHHRQNHDSFTALSIASLPALIPQMKYLRSSTCGSAASTLWSASPATRLGTARAPADHRRPLSADREAGQPRDPAAGARGLSALRSYPTLSRAAGRAAAPAAAGRMAGVQCRASSRPTVPAVITIRPTAKAIAVGLRMRTVRPWWPADAARCGAAAGRLPGQAPPRRR